MNRITRIAALASFTAVLGMASAASAVTVRTVFGGYVVNGDYGSNLDSAGLFGPVNGNLSGQAFTATFTTELTGALNSDNGVSSGQSLAGSDYGSPQLMTAVLTINEISYAFAGSKQSVLRHREGGANDEVAALVARLSPAGFEQFYMVGFGFGSYLNGYDLTETFSYSSDDVTGYGELALAGGSVRFNVTSVSGAVPEPATWALMIGGFGIAGLGLRRRAMALVA